MNEETKLAIEIAILNIQIQLDSVLPISKTELENDLNYLKEIVNNSKEII